MTTDIIKILIVDDNKDLTELMAISLSGFSDIHIVDTANTGAKALQKIQTEEIDIVLLDIIMPDMDGMQVLSKLHSLNLKKPAVIILSAIGSDVLIQRTLDLGAESALVKPADVQTIIREIRDVYHRYKIRDTENTAAQVLCC